jgi:predicted RNA methylase
MDRNKQTLNEIAASLAKNHPELTKLFIEKRRHQITNYFLNLFNFEVRYGKLQGVKISNISNWSHSDKAGMLFGLYELEVVELVARLSSKYSHFIDIGAGEGFYAVGFARNHFEKVIAFEMNEKGRSIIREVASQNNVLEKIQIFGAAERQFYKKLGYLDPSDAIILMDIEGFEFEIIDSDFFAHFQNSDIIVEVHDFMVESGAEKLQKLVASSVSTHSMRQFSTGARDLSGLKELETLSDTDRWLVCSEGRPRLMSWLHFSPYNNSH